MIELIKEVEAAAMSELNRAVIPHFIYIQINYTSIKFNKAPVSNKMTFITSDSLMLGSFMLSLYVSIGKTLFYYRRRIFQ